MLKRIKAEYPDIQRLMSDPSDTTKLYHVPGHNGRVGFISSMSDHFCGGCNRLRLGADGKLKVSQCDNFYFIFFPENKKLYSIYLIPTLYILHHVNMRWIRSASLAHQTYQSCLIYEINLSLKTKINS